MSNKLKRVVGKLDSGNRAAVHQWLHLALTTHTVGYCERLLYDYYSAAASPYSSTNKTDRFLVVCLLSQCKHSTAQHAVTPGAYRPRWNSPWASALANCLRC